MKLPLFNSPRAAFKYASIEKVDLVFWCGHVHHSRYGVIKHDIIRVNRCGIPVALASPGGGMIGHSMIVSTEVNELGDDEGILTVEF